MICTLIIAHLFLRLNLHALSGELHASTGSTLHAWKTCKSQDPFNGSFGHKISAVVDLPYLLHCITVIMALTINCVHCIYLLSYESTYAKRFLTKNLTRDFVLLLLTFHLYPGCVGFQLAYPRNSCNICPGRGAALQQWSSKRWHHCTLCTHCKLKLPVCVEYVKLLGFVIVIIW